MHDDVNGRQNEQTKMNNNKRGRKSEKIYIYISPQGSNAAGWWMFSGRGDEVPERLDGDSTVHVR